MIREKIFCGLDMGSQRLKASVIKIKRTGQSELLGAQESMTGGFKKSSLTDLGELSESIDSALRDLGKKTGVKLKGIELGVGGHLVEGRFSKAEIPLMDKSSKVITYSDIKKINRQARLLGLKMEEEILHDFPQHYVVDDTSKILNPAGLYARKLGVASLLIVTPLNLVGNIMMAIHQAGYEVSGVSFTSFISACVCLTKDMKRDGCLLIDIGATTTSLLFFKDGILRHLDIIPSGGYQLTNSIAEVLHLPFDLAEDIKRSHAVVLGDETKSDGDILVKTEDSYSTIKRRVICEAMEPQIAKLLSSLQKTLKSSHIHDKLKGGIIIVGGGSLLSGLIERIEKATGSQVEVGKADVRNVTLRNASVFTAALGLAQGSLRSSAGHFVSSDGSTNWMRGISGRIRELYEEYF